MYIVTGASDNHFKSLCQFLRSVPDLSRTFVWNLGLSEANLVTLATEFPTIRRRDFPYAEYPAYFNIHVNAGEYAWKPVAILKTAQEIGFEDILLWCDAGNRQMTTWDRTINAIRQQGLYSPVTPGTIEKWTHPACLKWFGVKGELLKKSPRDGAIVGFDLSNPAAVKILEDWAYLAQQKECIAPEGSDRSNHRQDQAVLTLLYYAFTNHQDLECSQFCLATHQDCD